LISAVKQGHVLYLLRQRLYNSRNYQKKDKRVASKEFHVQADKGDHDRIYKQLEVKLRKKKGSQAAVREMMVLTFKQQRSETTRIEDQNPTKVLLEKFPFLDKELPVSDFVVCIIIILVY